MCYILTLRPAPSLALCRCYGCHKDQLLQLHTNGSPLKVFTMRYTCTCCPVAALYTVTYTCMALAEMVADSPAGPALAKLHVLFLLTILHAFVQIQNVWL